MKKMRLGETDQSAINFLEVFPPETLRIIVKCLPFYQRARCAQVCKRFKKLVREDNNVFADVDMQGFSTGTGIDPFIALDGLGFYHPNAVKSLDLTYAQFGNKFNLFIYLRMFPNLEKLSLAYALAGQENPRTTQVVQLKNVKYPKLTFLNMTCNRAGGADDSTIVHIAANCPNLKVLLLAGTDVTDDALYAITHIDQRQNTIFGKPQMVVPHEPNTSLEVLDLSYTNISQDGLALALSKLDERTPALKKLYVASQSQDPFSLAGYKGNVTIYLTPPSEIVNVNALDINGATMLHTACSKVNMHLVKQLVEQYGADVNARKALPTVSTIHPKLNPWSPIYPVAITKTDFSTDAHTGLRPLHVCVQQTAIEIAKYLIYHGADVNAGDPQEQTPLMLAIKLSNLEMARLLLENGADVNKKDKFGWTAIHYVVPKQFPVFKDLLQLLLKHGADFNVVPTEKRTITTLCLDLGDTQKLEYLITNCGVSLSHEAHNGVVLYALAYCEEKILDDLVRLGAPMGPWKDGKTPLISALNRRASINVITTILKNGGANTINTLDALGKAAIHYIGQVPAQELDAYISVLVDHGADLLLKSSTGSTALMYMIRENTSVQTLQSMLKYGYSVKERDTNGWSILHAAVMTGNLPVIKYLVEHQANVNAQDCKGFTPLAALCKIVSDHFRPQTTTREDVIKFLLENGASLDVQDKLTGNTPLHWMAANINISPNLYKPTNIRNFNNELPVHVAVRLCNFALANKILNEDRVDINTPGPNGQTILLIALCKLAVSSGSCDYESVATPVALWGNYYQTFVGYPNWYNESTIDDSPWNNQTGFSIHELYDFVIALVANPSVDTNVKDVQNVTPLHVAFALENPKPSTGGFGSANPLSGTYLPIVRTLLRKGANVNAQDSLGDTPLHKIMKKTSLTKQEGVRLLLKFGANPSITNHLGRDALCYADLSVLSPILATPGIKLDSVDPQTGNTLLHNCIKWAWGNINFNQSEFQNVLNQLLQAGIDANLTNLQGYTALHLCCMQGYLQLAIALACHTKTDVNVPNARTGQTALHYALLCRRMNSPDLMFIRQDLVGVLLKQGANMYARDKNGQTPLDTLSPEGQAQLKALSEEVKSVTKAPTPRPKSPVVLMEAQVVWKQLEDPSAPNPWRRTNGMGRQLPQPSLFGFTPATATATATPTPVFGQRAQQPGPLPGPPTTLFGTTLFGAQNRANNNSNAPQ